MADDVSTTPGDTCNVTAAGGKPLHETIFDLPNSCFDVLLQGRTEMIGSEVYNGIPPSMRIRSVYRRLCEEKLPPYKECVAKVELDAVACLNATELLQYRLFTNFISLEFELDCANGGHRLSTNIEAGQREKVDGTPNAMAKCLSHGYKSKPADDGEGDDDINTSMLFEYRLFQRMMKCLEGYRGTGQDDVVDAGMSLWTELTDKMVCADPEGREILCKTLVQSRA